MKTVWKGSLSFGLVTIPIGLYAATEPHALGFTLLHASCKTPLQQYRWCSACDEEVIWDQTIKGIQKPDGSYFTLTPDEIKDLRPEKTESISLIAFVDHDAVETVYLEHHYYAIPSKKNDIAYSLFAKALEKMGKIGIGRFVMRDKEYTCTIRPYHNILLLTTLYYAYEVRNVGTLDITKNIKINSKELLLAQAFITKLSVKKFRIDMFKDTFAQQIIMLLKKRKSPGKIVRTRISRTVKKRKPNLLKSLNASLEQTRRLHPPAYARKR